MTINFRSFIFLISIYVAFFASGAASLTAEVTWNRMLIVVVGNSMSATAMIIVTFMGGLGLGSYIGGKIFGKRAASLVPYLLLEVTIGIYVLLSPSLFELLSHLFTSLAESVNDRASLTILRISVTLAALILPAFLHGCDISGDDLRSSARFTVTTNSTYRLPVQFQHPGGCHRLFCGGVPSLVRVILFHLTLSL